MRDIHIHKYPIHICICFSYVCHLTIHHNGGGLRPPPQQWGGRLGARPTVVDSIILDGGAASIAIPKTHPQSETTPMKAYLSKLGQMTLQWDRGIHPPWLKSTDVSVLEIRKACLFSEHIIMMIWINYKEKQKMGGTPKNQELTGKYHRKSIF